MNLLRKDLEEGGFYYTSSTNIDPPQVVSLTWYLKEDQESYRENKGHGVVI